MSRILGLEIDARGDLRRGVAAFLLAASAACGPVDAPRNFGVAIRPPTAWSRADPSSVRMPGRVLAAWSGPSGSSLAVYETLPDPRPDAIALAAELANRMEHLPGLRVERRGAIRIDGRPAAWLVMTGPGTGDALAASGAGTPTASGGRDLIPTRRTWIAVPRDFATIHIVWHGPVSSGPIDSAQFLAAVDISS